MFRALRLRWWLRRLQSTDAFIRVQACEALAHLGDAGAVDPLIERLGDEDDRVREAAGAALRKLVDEAGGTLAEVQVLVENLPATRDADWRTREGACKALGESGDPRAIVGLAEAKGDSSKRVRQAASDALAAIGNGAPEAMLARLQDRRPQVRTAICSWVGSTRFPTHAPLLVRRARDRDLDVRLAATEALCQLGGPTAFQALLRGLRDGDWRVRRAAIRGLGQSQDTRAVAFLARCLMDSSGRVRRAAVTSLAALGQESVRPLAQSLADRDPTVRRAACAALGQVQGADGVVERFRLERLEQALSDGEWTVRRAAARSLGQAGDTSFVPSLVERLGDSSTRVQMASAASLGALGDARAIEPLRQRLQTKDPELTAALFRALGNLGDAESIPRLIENLGAAEVDVREAAAGALTMLGEGRLAEAVAGALNGEGEARQELRRLSQEGDVRAVEPLAVHLREADAEAREAVCQALAAVGGEGAVDAIWALLSDSEWRVRAAACRAMGELRDARALNTLLARLGDESLRVRREAATALGALGDDRATDPLIARLGDDDPSVREASCEALCALGEERLATAVVGALADEVSALETLAALGREGDFRASDALARRLTDEYRQQRSAACRALGALGDTRAVDAVIDRLADGHRSVREAASSALRELGESELAEAVTGALNGQRAARTDLRQLAASGDVRCVAPLTHALWGSDEGRRQAAAEALVAIGPQATDYLVEALKDCAPDHARTIAGVLHDIHRRADDETNEIVCREHFLRFETDAFHVAEAGTLRCVRCPECAKAAGAILGVDEIIARLDAKREADWEVHDGVVLVEWTRRQDLFDFDRIEIISATDQDAEALCMQVGNDTKSSRARRYRRMKCRIAPDCKLSSGAMNMLRSTFGEVTVARCER